ncbi:cryptochrome/photolyase family protein [Thalassotalea aquiviva]|uniref:cryptochrome/photolyase family protein n=1 Tax=Thalassotalea aquiviva TaxID=3242415 RepID=UPI00352B375F
MKYKTLRLILGDQLNGEHSWFSQVDDNVLYLSAELKQENTYVSHHIQKVCAFFTAMAQFAKEQQDKGHHYVHLTLDDTEPFADLNALICHYAGKVDAQNFQYQRPDEFRLAEQLRALTLENTQVQQVESEHFLLPFADIAKEFRPGKHVKMEFFYRRMRKRFEVLVEDGKPVGGKWNFDSANRNKLKPVDLDALPGPLLFSHNISAIKDRLKRHNIKTIGKVSESLIWPTTRNESLELLHHFCQLCLPCFGRFQDAMTANSKAKWSLYHSRLSFSLNAKLIHPWQVIDAALAEFKRNESIDIAQVEGFIRQILGWREYIRAVYWANMPAYAKKNYFKANNSLPEFFWHGKTNMHCVQQAITQSLDYAYSHHIQRLMITGNFSLLTAIDPKQVDAWYLGIYVDAIEWVEMPNTRGMALFADGGIVGTKPYAASGSYINKMSDYCKRCHYDVKQRTGDKSCPFNSLYWHFMNKHRKQLDVNPRVGMIYRTWDKMEKSIQDQIIKTAKVYLNDLNRL